MWLRAVTALNFVISVCNFNGCYKMSLDLFTTSLLVSCGSADLFTNSESVDAAAGVFKANDSAFPF